MRSLDAIGEFPRPGDSIIIRDRWAPHAAFAQATILAIGGFTVDVESYIPAFEDRFAYTISREAWRVKCQAPNTAGAFTPIGATS